MRLLPLALCGFAVVGCAGNVADYVGPRSTIISPQLIRYGLDVDQSRCVSDQLGTALSPLLLRRFQRVAATVDRGWFEPDRLTIRDLMHVASSMGDGAVPAALDRAVGECGIVVTPRPAEPPAQLTQAGPRPPAWLNLGAAPTGQSIAVDAASLNQNGAARTAWFRLTNPGATAPTGFSYRLRIDCRARTITQLEHRRHDASGAVLERSDYPPDEQGPLQVEGGTVMEIAWLALCT